MTYNAYCTQCNKDLTVDSEKAMHCGKQVKILGTKYKVGTTNGSFGMHI